MPNDDRLGLREAMAADDDDLLDELGSWLVGDGPGFGPSDIDRKIRLAEAWLHEQRAVLRDQLCGDVWRQLETGRGFDALTEAATVADAVAAALGKPPANIVAVIMIRRGLRKLCEG